MYRINKMTNRINRYLNLNDMDAYIKEFYEAYEMCMYALYLKKNPKYSNIRIPVIIYSDVMDYRYNIRNCSGAVNTLYDNENDAVICSYSSIEEMVADGWKLD